jgi:dTDP-4-amino-4,6-dideoxygalactose transaminase
VYAGIAPRLVDNAPGRWGYDVAELEAALTDHTVAVVAVNLLGVGDQSEVLKSVLKQHPAIPIIHDSAQYLPVEDAGSWAGQHVVFSFGRGKPLNLLGGGLLLSRKPIPTIPESEAAFSARQSLLESSVAALAFNVLTHPSLYGLSSRLPGLGVGETVYRDLDRLRLPNGKQLMRVEAAWNEYRTRPGYGTHHWRAALDSWSDAGISILECGGPMEAHGLNLRLPLLCKSRAQRDHVLAQIETAGLGGSAMYRVPLNATVGVPQCVADQGPFPNAVDLANRLLTLPTYCMAGDSVVSRVSQIIRGSQ